MNIAILGYGIVGGGVHAQLRDGKLGIHVKRVLDVRRIEGLEDMLTDNIADILGDRTIDCVVETIGGMHPALSFVTSSLRAGKSVVTSNKELVSHALAPLMEGAGMHGAQIRFAASVGGGVPWIDSLLRQRRAGRLTEVWGIVNGTTNYILDAMAHGADFATALTEAQQQGYAEIDASADLDGLDAQRKCAISAALAFDTILEPEEIPTLGISQVRKADIDAFAAKGMVCKLLMRAKLTDAGVLAYVEPSLVGLDEMAAHVPTNHNCITMVGEQAGRLSFFGQGAGRKPTANNVVQDLLDIAAGVKYRPRVVQPLPVAETAAHAYYVRTTARDVVRPVMAEAWGDGFLTNPVPVGVMHEMVTKMRTNDPDTFVAGLPFS